MKQNRYERVLMTQEEYRKHQRNQRWLRKAIVLIPMALALVSVISAAFMAWRL